MFSPCIPSPEDVVRSVFEHSSPHRLSHSDLSDVLNVVRRILTTGRNPVQEECISSSCGSPGPSYLFSSFFWFLLSNEGIIEHVSKGSMHLVGLDPNDMIRHSAYSIVSNRDHHIVPPILNAGPSTSMSCRLHLRTTQEEERPFDVTFAKLSTRQLSSDIEIERSATLCVARAVPTSHGTIVFILDELAKITQVDNKSEVVVDCELLRGRFIGDLCSSHDKPVLNTIIETKSECSAELSFRLGECELSTDVRAVHNPSALILHCNINRICSLSSSPVSYQMQSPCTTRSISQEPLSLISCHGDPLSQLCSTIFSDDFSANNTEMPVETTSSIPSIPFYSSPLNCAEKEEKPKKARKPRAKKPKVAAEPVKNAVLKQLLASTRPSIEDSPAATSEASMYQTTTMSAQPIYLNNNTMDPAGYQSSSYMPSSGMEFAVGTPGQMVPHASPWPQEYYQQQQQVPYAQIPQSKGMKRKPATTPERPNKMPYTHNPAFAFSQSGPGMENGAAPIGATDDFHLQPINSHLSPYRYSPGSSPYWTSNGRPPSRSEMIRMELRNSLQAKQMANQQRLPNMHNATENPPSYDQQGQGIGADSLGFDLDIVVKDSDGSLMDAELDTVYDFNLAGGCGFQFDMENDATRCLVMKLLS